MLGGVVDLIALVVTVVALLAALGHGGYLALVRSSAKQRPGGQPAVEFAKKRAPIAGGALAVALLAVLIQIGGVPADIFAMLLGGGAGATSLAALQTTQKRFRSGEY